MDHSHMHHGDMSSPIEGEAIRRCSMNMLFTWNTEDLCIVFRWWHVQSNLGLVFSLLAVVALGAGYEAIRSGSRRYETWVAKRQDEVPPVTESTPLWWTGRNQVEVTKRAHIIKAVLYAIQNFYAFMLMLVFMTYNGWVMIAVSVGAFVGYLFFGTNTSSTKDTACH